jgi:hypothetical protein
MDSKVEKQSPFGQYEWVDVQFPEADTDVVIPYTRLRPESYNDIRWIDVAQGGLSTVQASLDRIPTYRQPTGSAPQVPIVYRAVNTSAKAFGPGYVVLRCTLGEYQTRLLLFVERNEG